MSNSPSAISNTPLLAQPPGLDHPVQITDQFWPEGTVPIVSICCITYNHEKFIREAIEGFLMQETTFPVEIIIHDDASTDGTRDIIREYETKHPQLFRLILQKENQHSKGKKITPSVLAVAHGEFIAMCEGDDFWFDPNKLQKQVEFLEENQSYSLCGHNSSIMSGGQVEKGVLPARSLTTLEMLGANPFRTATVMLRNVFSINQGAFARFIFCDWPIVLMASKYGDAFFMSDCMSCYRVHDGGMWFRMPAVKAAEGTVKMYYFLSKFFEGKHANEINRLILLQINQNVSDKMFRHEVPFSIPFYIFKSFVKQPIICCKILLKRLISIFK